MASTSERPDREDTPRRVSAAASPASAASTDRPFFGESEMARLMAATDWSARGLGPAETWPQPLRVAVDICLNSRFPIVLWWGPDLRLIYNDAYLPILGAKHPASLGAAGRFVWQEIWDIIGPMLDGVLREGKATWSDDQFLPLVRSGYREEGYFTFSYSPILDESSGVGGIFCAVTETTARVLAERRTRLARELAAALVEARTADEVCGRAEEALASDEADLPFTLLYLLDADGQRARLASSTGLEPGSQLAPPNVDLSDEVSEAADKAGLWPLGRVARTNRREAVADLGARWGDETVRAGRDLTPHTAIILPVTEPGRSAPSAVLVAGVSPRRALDDDYEGFYELLVSHLSAGLAAAHAYEDERRRAEALASIDRAKTAFFSNVSHEFRTPLTLMLGPLADMLQSDSDVNDAAPPTTMTPTAQADALPTKVRAELEVVQRNGLRLLKLVNTLLDFARIEAGRAQAVYEPTDLAAFTAELASAFRSLVEKAGMQLVVDCPPLSQPVCVDRDMWEKIVLNLLSNAFKFTLHGSITVALRPAGDGVEADAVELEVRDTGTGIPAAELPRLFERFHRIEGARARTHEGSGIGLALVQELVQLQGGAIRAESTEGTGTAFFVRLPLGIAHLPPEAISATRTQASTALGAAPFVEEAERWLPDAPEGIAPSTTVASAAPGTEGPSPSAGAAAPARPSRILIVDDNADMRDYLRRLLGQKYSVETAGNGRAALEAIQRELPELVLADVMMPELDGFGLLRSLRSQPETASLPVILLSARAGEEATIEGLQAGADDYLVKPFSAREVLSRVEARLEIARTRRDALDRARELEATFEAMVDGVAIYDAEGRILQLNPAIRQLLALDDDYPTHTIGERVPRLQLRDADGQRLPPDQSPPARAARGETFTGASSMDMWAHTLDGREIELNVSGAPVRSPTGQIIGGVCIYRDVTERRALEQRTHDVLEALLEMAQTMAQAPTTPAVEPHRETDHETDHEAEGKPAATPGVAGPRGTKSGSLARSVTADETTSDTSWRTLREMMALAQRVLAGQYTAAMIVNQGTGDLRPVGVVGLTSEIERQWWRDVAEKRVDAFLPPAVLERLYAGEAVTLDVAGQPPVPGTDYWGVTTVLTVPARLDAERVLLLAVEARDRGTFTPQERDLAQAAARLAALIVERERLVRERDRSLANELALREATRRMDEFLGIASHELRTPLTSITANIQMAERTLRALAQSATTSNGINPSSDVKVADGADEGAESQASRLDRAHLLLVRSDRQIVRLDRLVGDLLDVSRIQAGKLELLPERRDLLAIVREAVETQSAAWPDRRILVDLPPGPAGELAVECDADRIEQVLTNYLTNALKYSAPTASVRVSVRATGGTAWVGVRDWGPGLSPEQQARLFERFYRVPGIAQQSGSGIGLGLGLYITQTIVERHGGTVGVESTRGDGSTFWFTLPLAG